MPFSSDKSAPWEGITKDWIDKMLTILVRSAGNEEQLDRWKEKKFGRDEAQPSYIIGQFQNDLSIFRTSIREFIKHPDSIFMQFRGGEEDEIDMWRWESAPLPQGSSVEEKYQAYKNGNLVELDGIAKDAALEQLKAKTTLIVVAHGDAFPKIDSESALPVETAAGLSGEKFAQSIEQFLRVLGLNGVTDFTTRFIVCNIVMPQERAADENSFIGNYVNEVSRSQHRFRRVEASGTPFVMEGSSRYPEVRRLLLDQPRSAATSDTLVKQGWSQKFRATSLDGGEIEDSGFDVRLTEFERFLFFLSNKAKINLYEVMDRAQLLLAEPSASTADERLANTEQWQPLALLIQSIRATANFGANLWKAAEMIEITGAPNDAIEITQADGSLIRIENLRRDLAFFKEKMAYLAPVLDAKITEAHRLAYKKNVQFQFRYLNAVERNFSPHVWQRSDGMPFSSLAQLGDYRNDEMTMMLSLARHDEAFNRIARREIFAQTGALSGTDIAWRFMRVRDREGGGGPDRAVARALSTMSDQDLADALLFDVTLLNGKGGASKAEVSFSGETTRELVACIDACVNEVSPDFVKKITNINTWHRRGLLAAFKDPRPPLAGLQDDVKVLRPASATAVGLALP